MERLKVLVVDDEPGMRAGVLRALRGLQVHVPDVGVDLAFDGLEAESAEAAMALLEESSPDLILLDYKLPGKSGLDVLEWLEERNLDLLVVMITAYASIETAVVATKRGAYDFLAKPFTPAELRATLAKTARHLVLHRRARQAAEEKRQVRFQFISVLAHELKAPLAAVTGYLYLVRDHALGGEVGAYDGPVGRCLERLDGMQKMVLDLLDLTRIESGQKQRTLEPLALNQIVRKCLETMQPLAAARDVELLLDAPDEIRLQADAGELEIILNNLVSNAIKYNREGGRVTVSLRSTAQEVRLAVADTGIGMTEEERARLFQEFVRIHNEETAQVAGSGLGLSIVRKLVRLYQGRVEVVSARGEGSTFTVVLPALEKARGST